MELEEKVREVFSKKLDEIRPVVSGPWWTTGGIAERWRNYLKTLEEYGVEYRGVLLDKIFPDDSDSTRIQDPLNMNARIIMPKEFATKVAAMKGLP
jgi:hypothetical protein